jgi:hypothetical protein
MRNRRLLRAAATMTGTLLLASAFGMATAATAEAATTQVVKGEWADGGKPSRATCPDGTHLIGGGYVWRPVYTHGGSPADTLDIISPSQADGKSWVTQSHTSGYGGGSQAYAICETDS